MMLFHFCGLNPQAFDRVLDVSGLYAMLNPIVKVVLRSPIHHLMSKNTLL